jgi:hypothetical protein
MLCSLDTNEERNSAISIQQNSRRHVGPLNGLGESSHQSSLRFFSSDKVSLIFAFSRDEWLASSSKQSRVGVSRLKLKSTNPFRN